MDVVCLPVYVVRHGQSVWNVLRLTQGQTSHPRLTAAGREQAKDAARLIATDLRTHRSSAPQIITSDLVRAVETAEILSAHLGATVSHDRRLREQHLGSLEGRSYEETWAAADEIDWSDPTLSIAGGESLMAVHDRMADALRGLDPARVTVLVSHGDAIRAAIAHVTGVLPHESAWVDVPNGAVARIDDSITWLGQ